MSYHAMSLPHLGRISERIRVSRLVVDDDDVRQGQADRLSRLATQVLRKSDRFIVGIKIATRAHRLLLEPLQPCGQPLRFPDQPRAECSGSGTGLISVLSVE